MKPRHLLTAIVLLGTLTAARGDDLPPELAWVPPSCTGFIHVRVADLLNSLAGKCVLKSAGAINPQALDQLEHGLGTPLARIDRITILLPELDPNARQPGFVVRVTTTRAYDRRDVMSALKVKANDPRRGAGDLYALSGQGMLHFDDDKNYTLLPNDEGAVSLLGRMLSQRATGRQTAALKAAAGA